MKGTYGNGDTVLVLLETMGKKSTLTGTIINSSGSGEERTYTVRINPRREMNYLRAKHLKPSSSSTVFGKSCMRCSSGEAWLHGTYGVHKYFLVCCQCGRFHTPLASNTILNLEEGETDTVKHLPTEIPTTDILRGPHLCTCTHFNVYHYGCKCGGS